MDADKNVEGKGFYPDSRVWTPGEPHTSMMLVKNVWIKQMYFEKAGDSNPGHAHLFDHATLLATGRVRVDVNGSISEFSAPCAIWIKAGAVHTLTATKPNTVCYCIHAIRDGDGVEDIIDPASIPAGAKFLSSIPGAKDLIEPA